MKINTTCSGLVWINPLSVTSMEKIDKGMRIYLGRSMYDTAYSMEEMEKLLAEYYPKKG
jgi:hypothetical protein